MVIEIAIFCTFDLADLEALTQSLKLVITWSGNRLREGGCIKIQVGEAF